MVMWMEGRRRSRADAAAGGGRGWWEARESQMRATVSAVKVAQTNQRRTGDENSQSQHFPLSVSHQISCEI